MNYQFAHVFNEDDKTVTTVFIDITEKNNLLQTLLERLSYGKKTFVFMFSEHADHMQAYRLKFKPKGSIIGLLLAYPVNEYIKVDITGKSE